MRLVVAMASLLKSFGISYSKRRSNLSAMARFQLQRVFQTILAYYSLHIPKADLLISFYLTRLSTSWIVSFESKDI